MKLYNSKPSNIIKYSLIIFTTIILIGIAGLFTFGFNSSYEISNYYQIEAKYFEDGELDSLSQKSKDILKDISASKIEIESISNGYFNTAIVKFSAKNIDNIDELKDKLYNSIYDGCDYPTDSSYVSVSKITNSTEFSFKWISLAVVLSTFAILFVLGFIVCGVYAGLGLSLTYMYSILTSLSLVLFTRLELTISSAISIFIISLISALVFLVFITYIRTLKRDDEFNEPVLSYANKILTNNKKLFICFGIMITASVLALMLSLNVKVIIVSAEIAISIIVSCASVITVGIPVYAHMQDNGETKRKALISRSQKQAK